MYKKRNKNNFMFIETNNTFKNNDRRLKPCLLLFLTTYRYFVEVFHFKHLNFQYVRTEQWFIGNKVIHGHNDPF